MPATGGTALRMDLGNEGVARGYNDRSVFMIGTFGSTRNALIELPVAPYGSGQLRRYWTT